MRRHIASAALVALTITALPAPVRAAPGRAVDPDPVAATKAAPEVRVVNNHGYRIRVVLVDQQGRHHSLGRVAPRKAGVFELDARMLVGLPVVVKVIVDDPVWSAARSGDAIRTAALYPRAGVVVHVWVEPDLLDSWVDVRTDQES